MFKLNEKKSMSKNNAVLSNKKLEVQPYMNENGLKEVVKFNKDDGIEFIRNVSTGYDNIYSATDEIYKSFVASRSMVYDDLIAYILNNLHAQIVDMSIYLCLFIENKYNHDMNVVDKKHSHYQLSIGFENLSNIIVNSNMFSYKIFRELLSLMMDGALIPELYDTINRHIVIELPQLLNTLYMDIFFEETKWEYSETYHDIKTTLVNIMGGVEKQCMYYFESLCNYLLYEVERVINLQNNKEV